MTDAELMKWYEKWWREHNPDFTLCKLVFEKTKNHPEKEWCLHVNRPSWTNGASVKYLKDAEYQWNKAHNTGFVKKQALNIQVELPFNPYRSGKKQYKTIGCCLEVSFFEKVKKLCDDHNISINALIKKLLEQVIKGSER